MSIRQAARKLAAMIIPWPPKHERKAAIAAAERNRDAARAKARQAAAVSRQISRIAYEDNHFAVALMETIRGQQRGEGT